MEQAPSGLQQVPLTIASANGRTHRFTVEVARTPEEQATGLMNRQALAPDRGMIFPYVPPRDASFWMKNTLIPLDIIFVRSDGTIARIEPQTVPLSLEPVPSLEPVGAVLEIPGGRAAELGIQPGDRVKW
ncbi:MAG: FIG007785: exported protein [uncultured Sphingomonas sp.]|uniref:FIG007785: exported protein n=1 Tax=uncultured Sphingomonas sp. TaxID=158754 RepID=A0A6J4T1Q1_9SPHN|nr:MAG: FIG007785: exported protein [uncultured Sphingomonas sp.]